MSEYEDKNILVIQQGYSEPFDALERVIQPIAVANGTFVTYVPDLIPM